MCPYHVALFLLADKLGRRQKGPVSRYYNWWLIIATAACWISLCLGLDILWKGIIAIPFCFIHCIIKSFVVWAKYLFDDSIYVYCYAKHWMQNSHLLKLSPKNSKFLTQICWFGFLHANWSLFPKFLYNFQFLYLNLTVVISWWSSSKLSRRDSMDST